MRDGGDIRGNVDEFERVQSTGRALRQAREDYADARGSLDLLREERARRAADRSKLKVFLRRAFSF